MMAGFPMFRQLTIETQANCNRACSTCLRVNYPGLGAWRFKPLQISTELVRNLIDQAAEMGFKGKLCLQWFNEPLLDTRLAEFAVYAKSKGTFRAIYINTNGDALTPTRARTLDGALDYIPVSFHDNPRKEAAVRRAFKRTELVPVRNGHKVTHFSPYHNLPSVITEQVIKPCVYEARHRMIITCTGEMALCCEDIGCVWDLGKAGDSSLDELWFSDRHREIVEQLSQPEGRRQYPYCRICPR